MTTLLQVNDLRITIGSLSIVDGVDFAVERGSILGLAGESGSGKRMTALSLLGLLPPGARTSGRAVFNGRDLLALKAAHLRQIRGRKVAMVFQDPTSSLHPMLSTEQVRMPTRSLRCGAIPTSSVAECGSAFKSPWRWPANPSY